MNMSQFHVSEFIHDPDWDAKGRGNEAESRKLAKDLEQHGQLLPLLAIRGEEKLVVIDGNRRLSAARLIQLQMLDVIVLESRPSKAELLFMQESLDNHFKKQSLFERLRRFEELRALGETVGSISSRTGYSQGAVSRILGLSRLCGEARELLRQGVDVEKAFVASQIDDPGKQVQLMREGASLTREQLRRRAHGVEMRSHKAVFPLPSGLMVVVQGKQMTLKDAIDTLLAVTKELRQSLRDGMEITTAARVLADKAKVQQ